MTIILTKGNQKSFVIQKIFVATPFPFIKFGMIL